MENITIKGTPKSGLVGSTLGFFIGFTAVVTIGATIKFFKPGLQGTGISDALIGLLVASPNLSGSLLRIPFAAWSDSIGGKKPLLVLLVISVIGMGGLVIVGFIIYPLGITSVHYGLLLALGFLSGCGLATFSVGISQTSYWFPQKEQGKALGLYGGIGNTAPGIFSLVLAIILPVFGLGGSYLTWFIVLLSGTILYEIVGRDAWSFQLENQGLKFEDAEAIAREKGQELFPSHKIIESLKISGKISNTWLLVGLYFTSFGGFIALSAWFPTYWSTFHGVDNLALVLTALFIIIGSIARVFSGSLADRFSGSRVTLAGITSIIIGGSIMMFAGPGNVLLAVLAMVIITTGMGIVNAGVFKLVPKAIPKAVGGAAGWIGGLGAFGGFVIPPTMGLFVDLLGSPGYSAGFVVFIVLGIVSLMFLQLIKRSKVD
ncbi:MAG: MFS transporter [Promethearchaeota archaeon]